MTKVGRADQRAQRVGRPGKEGALNRGHGGGSEALHRVAL